MQLFVLGLALAIFLYDTWAGAAPQGAPDLLLWPMLLAPKLLLVAIYKLLCVRTYRRLGTDAGQVALRRLDRYAGVQRLVVFGLYLTDVFAGGLAAVRNTLGDWVLIDELLVLTPTVLVLLGSWWAYYPIDRRLREAQLFRLVDEGRPVYPVWSLGQYLLAQIRHQLALVGLPLLLLLAWSETLNLIDPRWLMIDGVPLQPVVMLAGAGLVFVFAPVVMRHVWDTQPLPEGGLRTRLLDLCRHYRVGVRELLLWRTFGGMVNGAVMGVLAPWRYILLTDALLDQLPDEQVEAVMAHEIAHIRRHHLFWLLGAAAALMATLDFIGQVLMWTAAQGLQPRLGEQWINDTVVQVSGSVLALALWALAFGWVSRRFERQADAFAVAHLTAQFGADRVLPAAINVMSQALQRVADLNHVSPRKPSWRHGSIVWRQRYLAGLNGQPAGQLPIDHVVTRIKIIAALLLLLAVVLHLGGAQWLALMLEH